MTPATIDAHDAPPHTDADAPPADAPPADEPTDWPERVIPADWWAARPVLRSVRDWARARLIPPDLLLGDVLAELAVRVPTTIVLPAIIGSPASTNFGVVMVAETGVGKTAGGRNLIAHATRQPTTGELHSLGTGEGLTEALLDPETRTPHGRPVIVHADEGRALENLIARKGSTLVAVLCSAVSGAHLGQGNADGKLRRSVAALSYRLAFTINLQPAYLRGVLADIDAGLPQRFLFLAGTGHQLTAWDQLDPATRLELPDVDAEQFPHELHGSRRYRVVPVPQSICRQIRREHLARLHDLDAGLPVAAGSHRNLLRLRVAFLLAVADGRSKITGDDWELALPVVEASDATVAYGQALRAQEDAERARAERERLAGHAVAADAAVEQDRTARLARKITGWVRDTAGMTRRDVARRLSAAARALTDDAIAYAIAHGWVIERAQPSHTGDDRRVLYPGEVRP